ncbi:hypothetical protein SVIO_098270 [Streptomyces violaceusniger]|uniref:Uncharacterized protein n=1 Tax=Streptomyces violaceusniger TaxID=68280 RepID=A0A4D4LFQ3_STRVO|nr:hypothetical protein SVIO_098270 [Streptomyces violaceusniger]
MLTVDVDAVSPLGYARYVHGYPEDLLEDILAEARRVAEYGWEARSADRYLNCIRPSAAPPPTAARRGFPSSRSRPGPETAASGTGRPRYWFSTASQPASPSIAAPVSASSSLRIR